MEAEMPMSFQFRFVQFQSDLCRSTDTAKLAIELAKASQILDLLKKK
jgi:hypothetical protein